MASSKRSETLKVLVAGGGPAGLTFALNLSMLLGEKAQITVYEGRWTEGNDGNIRWKGEKEKNIRRAQVVTLQDHVTAQLPKYIQRGIFRYVNETVWPSTRNIPIAEVEDRLLDLAKPFVDVGWIKLIPENLDKDNEEELEQNDFHLLIGADGAGSFVRDYCSIQMINEGKERSCGVEFSIPSTGLKDNEKPLHQATNCILSSVQTRYLVNASYSRRGFLNIRLNKREYDELQTCLDTLKAQKIKFDLEDSINFPNRPIWTTIRQGLALFHIAQKYATRVTAIQINIRHSSVVLRELQCKVNCKFEPGTKKVKKRLAFLIGDAAMNVHFWLGRGMNSAMKEAMALARNICSAFEDHDWDPNALNYLDFLEYEGFMARLRAREQGGRSLRVLDNPIDHVIDQAGRHTTSSFARNLDDLIELLKKQRDTFRSSGNWPHDYIVNDEELKRAVSLLQFTTLAELKLAAPWPVEEWSGKEVLIEETYPISSRQYLSMPKASNRSVSNSHSYSHSPSSTKSSSGPPKILWFADGSENRIIDNLNLNRDSIVFVRTINEANIWLAKHSSEIKKSNRQLKLICPGRDQEETRNLIRLVRSEFPQTPVLIYPNGRNESTADREFYHVSVTDDLNDIYAFVKNRNVSELQWSDGLLSARYFSGERLSLMLPLSSSTPSSSSSSSSSSPASSPPPSPSSFAKNKIIVWIVDKSRETSTKAILKEVEKKSGSVPKIKFFNSYYAFERYFQQNYRTIGKIICRGHYDIEERDCVDILKLCDLKRLSSSALLVTTSSTDQHLKEYLGRRHKNLENYWDRLNFTRHRSGAVDFIIKS